MAVSVELERQQSAASAAGADAKSNSTTQAQVTTHGPVYANAEAIGNAKLAKGGKDLQQILDTARWLKDSEKLLPPIDLKKFSKMDLMRPGGAAADINAANPYLLNMPPQQGQAGAGEQVRGRTRSKKLGGLKKTVEGPPV